MSDQQCIDWAREINGRWICHGHLQETAARWMEHLAATAPARLAASARQAFHLVKTAGRECDPKPWFYAGLFSLSSPEEQQAWLSTHPFTAAAVGGHGATYLEDLAKRPVKEDTARLLIRIQSALDATLAFQQTPGPS
jgi:hypothetical protein